MAYITAEAPTRLELAACVQCGLCLPHCPTYRLTGRETAGPRGRLTAMSAVLEGVLTVDQAFDDTMSFCLQCRACEAVCPGLVKFGRVMEGARAELDAQRPNRARRLRRFVFGSLLPNRQVIALATRALRVAQQTGLSRVVPGAAGRGISGLRRVRSDPSWMGREVAPVGEQKGTIALLNGCVMDAWFGPVHDATVGLLSSAGYRVVIPQEQTCCGALAAHDGQVAIAKRLAEVNSVAFADADLIVSDAAGCTAHLKEYDHWTGGGLADRVRDVTELVATLIESGDLPIIENSLGDVAVQDPCHLRHAQRITSAPRSILRAAGYNPVEIDQDGICCGAAGIYSLLNPEASHELGTNKATQVVASGAPVVASANPGCEMQLRAHLDGKARVAHPVELYWESLNGAS